MTKTNYDQRDNFQKNWKENWKEFGQPDSCFWSLVYEIDCNTIQKQKNLKVHPLKFEKFFNWTQRKTSSELSE